MRIGAISDELDQNLRVALEECTRLGLEELELRTIDGRGVVDLDHDELGEAVADIRASGLTVSVLAAPIFKCALPGHDAGVGGAVHGAKAGANLNEHWEMLERAVALASAHGVRFVRIFSFWRVPTPTDVREEVVAMLAEAQRRAAAHAVELLLENEHDCNVGTAPETEEVLSALPGLRVIWDPGNHVRAGGDPASAFPARFAHRVAHVHLKDVDTDGRWVPLTRGLIPFDAVLAQLEEIGYDGALSLETHCRIDGSVVRATEYSLAALRALLERPLLVEASA